MSTWRNLTSDAASLAYQCSFLTKVYEYSQIYHTNAVTSFAREIHENQREVKKLSLFRRLSSN